ncbi:MAG TPA: hypothetical protein VF461_03110, partial [Gemmatimonadaceae bacterium]
MRRIVALLVLATLAACGGGSDATAPSNQTPAATFTGTFVLQTLNGKPLPYTSGSLAGDYITTRSYSLTISAGGNWTSATST